MMENPEFDLYASDYDSALGTALALSGEDKDFFAQKRVAWLETWVARLDIEVRSVMDFGCGVGSSAPYLAGMTGVQSLLGVDISTPSLALAEQAHGSPRVKFQSIEQYQPRAEIDLAFCNGVFHHIQPAKRATAMNYVHRSLRPGGHFALWENNPLNPGTRYVMSQCPFDQNAIPITHFESRRLMRESGFEIIGTSFQFIFPRALRCLRWIEPYLARMPFGAQYLILGCKS